MFSWTLTHVSYERNFALAQGVLKTWETTPPRREVAEGDEQTQCELEDQAKTDKMVKYKI